MVALILMLSIASTTPMEDSALWSAIHLTAKAAIDAAGLAQSQAASPEIRNLGKLVVHDAGELDRRLSALAAEARVALADRPKPGQTQLQELRTLQGLDFDRLFLNFNYGASETLRKQMRAAAQQSGSPALRDLVAKFDGVIWQDQFLSGWCLGHCVPGKAP